MSEPISIEQAQKSVRKVLARIEKRLEEEEYINRRRELNEKIVRGIVDTNGMDKWSFMGDK